MLLHVAG